MHTHTHIHYLQVRSLVVALKTIHVRHVEENVIQYGDSNDRCLNPNYNYNKLLLPLRVFAASSVQGIADL